MNGGPQPSKLSEVTAIIFAAAIVLFLWAILRNSNPIHLEGTEIQRAELEASLTGETLQITDRDTLTWIGDAISDFYLHWDPFPGMRGGGVDILRLYTADDEQIVIGFSGDRIYYLDSQYTIRGDKEALNTLLRLWEPLLPEGMKAGSY